jgi:hypothetical protein
MFAAESYAAVEVGGMIEVRGRLRENHNDVNENEAGSTAFWQEKVNLWVDAKVAEGLKGYVELMSGYGASKGWFYWGQYRTSDAAPNSVLYENNSFGFMQIRYAYIDFMIPSTPVGIKIGHMPVVLGHSIWADTKIWGSDGMLLYVVPIKELMIALGTLKGYETASNTDRTDADLYVFMLNYTFMPKNTAGFNASYIHRSGASGWGDETTETPAGDGDGYPDAGESGNRTLGVATAWGNTNSADGTLFSRINDVKVWNIMLTVDGQLDFGLGYKFEVDKQFGTLIDRSEANSVDIKASGLAVLAGASFTIPGAPVTVGFDAAYGSGDKCSRWADNINPSKGIACATTYADGAYTRTGTGTKYEGYFNFNDYGYTMIYEDIVGQKRTRGTKSSTGTYTSGLTSADFGLYNTWYAKLGASAAPIKDMSVGLDLYYLNAVVERYYGQKKHIGWEADLNFSYNIYKNLKWTFLAGYFIPGKHYEAIDASDYTKDDSAWAFEQKLSLKF